VNILVINHYAGSPRHGMEHRPYALGREWAELGHTVTVVAGSYSHVRSKNPDVQADVSSEIIEGIRYVWLRTPTYSGNGLRRVASMGAFVAQLFRHAATLLVPKPDVVVASSTYPFDVIPARWLARKAGARFVFEVHDLWPLTPKELGRYPAWHPFILAAQMAEDAGYRDADAVVSLLPGTLPYMESRGLAREKFVWIPNGLSRANGRPKAELPAEPHTALLDRLRGEGKFIVGYAGGHGLSNSLDVLLAAAALTRDDGIAYVLLGDGPEKQRLVRDASSREIGNVHFLPRVASDAVPRFLERVDVAYLGWHDSPLYRFGISPNKLLDYMAAGLPVIHAVRAFNDPVAESGAGISVPPDDADAIARAARELKQMSPASRHEMGERGRRFLDAHYDYRTLAGRFLEFVTGARN